MTRGVAAARDAQPKEERDKALEEEKKIRAYIDLVFDYMTKFVLEVDR